MGPRAGLSTLLVAGALVLLAAIAVGNGMGSRVIGRFAGREPAIPTVAPIAAASSGPETGQTTLRLRRRSVLSVATDPAFPDPRITPEPTPPPTPIPPPRRFVLPSEPPPLATAKPSIDVAPTPKASHAPYTSPPLAIPLVKHSPGETSPPEEATPLASASPQVEATRRL